MVIEMGDGNRRSLYDAAMLGSVDTLYTLLEADPLVIDRVSLTSSPETPLHVAACRGHLEFAKAILKHMPGLAAELDAERCSALHLAAANGHAEVVKVLLDACPDARSLRDGGGRIPLHLAAMRGRVDVVKELISFRPVDDSIHLRLEGESVLHLCVKYNRLDPLEVLVASLKDADNGDQLLNSIDARGNTALHLAVLLKQEETVDFLLSVPKIREGSAVSTLHENRSDWLRGDSRSVVLTSNKNAITSHGNGGGKPPRTVSGCFDKWVGPLANYPKNWIEETRGSLMTVATLIASITFAPVLNPPGGVWQEDTTSGYCVELNIRNITCLAGNAVAAYYDQGMYNGFMVCNTIAFMGSLSVLFLLVSGFPPKNKFFLWLLTTIVCVTVAFLGFTFILAMILVTPDQSLNRLRNMIDGFISSWSVLVGILGIVNAVILAYLIIKWSRSRRNSAAIRKGGTTSDVVNVTTTLQDQPIV